MGEFIESSVMFQTGDVLKLYVLIFGTLATIAFINFRAACKKNEPVE